MNSRQELHGVVDEEDEPGPIEPATGNRKKLDWDTILAYKTHKIVRIRDRYLGILYWTIVFLVVLYIVVVAIGIEGKHQKQEPGVGSIILRIKPGGKVYNAENDDVFDEADLRYPEIESNAAFITTRQITQRKQKIGSCVDYDKRCGEKGQNADVCGDANSGNTCSDEKFCNSSKAWCPSIGIGNIDSLVGGSGDVVVDTMSTGVEDLMIEFQAGISFPGLTKKEETFFVAGKQPTEDDTESETSTDLEADNNNTDDNGSVEYENISESLKSIRLGDLLQKANVKFDDIKLSGAVLAVSFYWNCNVHMACDAIPVVQRVDANQGYFQRKSRYYNDSQNQKTRDGTIAYGIRILADSSGIGKKSSLVLFIIQLGSCIALLKTASMIADFIMLNCFRKEKTDMYYKCKVIETQDYSDLQDRINVIKDLNESSRLLQKRPSRRGGSGSRAMGSRF